MMGSNTVPLDIMTLDLASALHVATSTPPHTLSQEKMSPEKSVQTF